MNRCGICKATGDFPLWRARNMRYASDELFAYFQCSGCGCLQIEELPVDLDRYYKEEGGSCLSEQQGEAPGVGSRGAVLKGALRRAGAVLGAPDGIGTSFLDMLIKPAEYNGWFARAGVTKKSMILDVGCGTGALLARIREDGFYNASGIDPFIKKDIRYDNGLEVRKGRLEQVAGEELFDLIMMNHSLEHIPDQFSVFANLARLISRDGTALLRVPVASSYAWEEYGTDWVHLDSPRNLYLHTEQSIGLLAKGAGLKVAHVEYDSWELQFYGSELLQKGILIGKQDGFLDDNGKKAFGSEQMKSWRLHCEELNSNGRGDTAAFYLVRA